MVGEGSQPLRTHLSKYYGPCWVTEHIWGIIWETKLLPFHILAKLKSQVNQPDIDPDIFEEVVLGTLAEATMKPAEATKRAAADGKAQVDITIPEPDELFVEPLHKSIGALTQDFQKRFEGGVNVFKDMRN